MYISVLITMCSYAIDYDVKNNRKLLKVEVFPLPSPPPPPPPTHPSKYLPFSVSSKFCIEQQKCVSIG